MDSEIVAPVQDERVAVGAVELCDGLAALDVPRVARNGDDGVKDDVFGQQVEEVPAIDEAVEPLLDDPEERLQRLEVVEVVDRGHQAPRRAQACAVRPAKSAKLAGRCVAGSSQPKRTSAPLRAAVRTLRPSLVSL